MPTEELAKHLAELKKLCDAATEPNVPLDGVLKFAACSLTAMPRLIEAVKYLLKRMEGDLTVQLLREDRLLRILKGESDGTT
ncbi:MAG: hypothetical protein ACYTG0_38635 [Planctomycetota bacterium]|jgi:hypothetical protein